MAPRKKYYVGKSKIHGEGSFAKKDLSAGEYIGKAHTVKKLYSDYDFTELGMKHNHSENPSTLDVEIGNERHLIAKRPIKKGEELTTNYRVLQDLKQPEDFENGGWLDKYDAPQAQNGIEGTMGGLTDAGFNYNGAWGGPSMQMGGNIMPAMAGANQTVPMARNGRRQPIYTSDPKDPRLRNYKDSLSLYNQTKWLQDLKFDGSRTIGSGQPIYGRLATNRNVINNPDAEWNYYNNINRNIRPVAYLDEYYVNSPNDRQPTTLSGRVALYKKPVQPVTYKKSQPKPPRKLEKPGKVDLPEQIQFKDLPQPKGDYKIGAPELQMISDKPTKYSFTYGDERNQKSIYFPNKTIWQAFVDQYDGLNTTERAGSFEATPVTYSTYRRPNPAFKDVKFAMGGSLPGSVGFTYARTAGAAPANGPYAKKTKASARDGKNLSYSQWKKQYNLKETPDYNLKRAWELGYTPDKTGHLPTVDNQTGQFLKAKGHPTLQLELDWYNSPEGAEFRSKNAIDSSGKFFKYVPKGQNGQEMKYYQEGLDFKPKTISKNGGWLDKFDNGGSAGCPRGYIYVNGECVLKPPTNYGDLATQSGVPSQSEVARQANIKKEAEAYEKKKEARARYEKTPKVGPAKQRNYSEQVQAEEQRKRLNQAYAAKNPEVTVDESGNIVTSGYGRFMQTYGENLDKFARSWETPLAIEGAASLAPLIGRGLAKGVTSVGGYLGNTYMNVAKGESALPIAWKSPAVGLSQQTSQGMFNSLINSGKLTDAERALLVDYTYNPSPFTRPTGPIGEAKRQALNDLIKKYKLDVGEDVILTRKFDPANTRDLDFGDRPLSFSAGIGQFSSSNKDRLVVPSRYTKQLGDNLLVNDYSYLSNEAIQRMFPDPLGQSHLRQLAMDLRGAALEREVIGTGLKFKRLGKVKNDIGGYDYVVAPKKQQDGGDIPVDPMGYWNPENVGGPVTIPSNVITMEGVDQPLLGISDTGDVQYMMPGEDYEFDGEYVTEYPMAKGGVSVNNADAQPLKKLDQLLNFTNYNKPTKGGWLDKYN